MGLPIALRGGQIVSPLGHAGCGGNVLGVRDRVCRHRGASPRLLDASCSLCTRHVEAAQRREQAPQLRPHVTTIVRAVISSVIQVRGAVSDLNE